MKFAYYITNLHDCTVQGTNDAGVAQQLAECEEFFVVHAKSGDLLLPGGDTTQVQDYAAGIKE
jgi:hypothetical protein